MITRKVNLNDGLFSSKFDEDLKINKEAGETFGVQNNMMRRGTIL